MKDSFFLLVFGTDSGGMILTCAVMVVILVSCPDDIWTLPAPSRVFVDSVNMKHILRWRPPRTACNTTVLFSVQYQGEFELLLKNDSWMDAFDCQQIPSAHCDLTFEMGSDSDYDMRVRAQCGSEISDWKKLGSPFNRRNTQLTVPEMTVKTAGDTLQVLMKEFPLSAAVSVTVWKKDEQQKSVYSVTAEQPTLLIEALQEGTVYCVTAQLMLHSGGRSNSTRPHCVLVTGPEAAAWRTPTTVTVTVIVMLGLLFAVFWSVVHCRLGSCKNFFKKEEQPQAIGLDFPVIPMLEPTQYEEFCELKPQVLNSDSV
ncbi:Interleukin-20 receptor subunit beta [Oryzias melastigma]|uniref:Interleukin-20 receptor subunit beta n=1 Tax=Oryzias melastigma TaxID=30732 RepID=A0A834BVF1_ORYME|nr:Interleukin-20 receptor subunit beta [Oryzias melastigma]